ncbi:ABC transporter substrate-binding protein [Photobacterium swingsii]|uniref:ABC transporter substrate-binding protein n=3 Tax=Photobacterium swingsii TaxID=680026 RepID=A0A2T3PBF3_9GAMM|nr:ABC transporter substrate-binding protein [Photobacterium swingsii]PSW26530.1 ABC transporter substrate-binding protein [Photobacterium swingsii]
MYRFIIILLMLLPQAVFAYNTPIIVLTTFSPNSLSTLIADYKAKHPNVNIKVLHRHEDAAARLLGDPTHDIDMVITTSIGLFELLQRSKTLITLPSVNDEFANEEVKATLQHFNNRVALLGYSRYGFMWNQRYLEKHNLDRPSSWESLTHPQYFQHIIMATPSRSTSSHYMVESILQQYGWQAGWKLLYQISGNLASVSMFNVTDQISRGLVGVAPVVDAFAFKTQKPFPFIGFSYQPNSPVLPAYMASIKNLHHSTQTVNFLQYLEAFQGNKSLHPKSQLDYRLPHKNEALEVSQRLDFSLINQRSDIVKKLFTHTIVHSLALHNKAWQLIHKVQTFSQLTAQQHQQLNQAITLATTPPISEQDVEAMINASERDAAKAQQNENDSHLWCLDMYERLNASITMTENIVMEYEVYNHG